MPDYLPHDMMDAEDDQILTELGDRTMSDMGLDSPTASIADLLDPTYGADEQLWRRMFPTVPKVAELHILMLYAKLGRNAFLRHHEATAPGEEGSPFD